MILVIAVDHPNWVDEHLMTSIASIASTETMFKRRHFDQEFILNVRQLLCSGNDAVQLLI
jgi:hypothetical protein